MSSLLDGALAYARKGWPVIPLEPRGKMPITTRGIHEATTDEDAIRMWWSNHPDANVGVATGSSSGLVVIDIDGSRGRAAWNGLSRKGIPETTSQQTGREDGGEQYFFKAPERKIKTREQLFAGIDIAGEGGWVVVPPSIHPSGRAYSWTTRVQPADMPDWLISIIENPPVQTTGQIEPVSSGELDDLIPPHTDEDAPPGTKRLYIADIASHDSTWEDLLLKSNRGLIKPCLSNALKIIRNHSRLKGLLKFNQRSQNTIWDSSPPWRTITPETQFMTDADAIELAEFIADVSGADMGKTTLFDAMVAESMHRQYDPVADYLTSLRWDGEERLNMWIPTYFGAEPTPFVCASGAAWAISAVARTFRPGCQADYMIVLEGLKQGEKKSSGLEILAGSEFYADIVIDPSAKDTVLSLHGPWIVEWGELAGMSNREAQTAKQFLTRKTDRIRPPYQRAMANLQRRVVIAGTTNDEVYLKDQTGNRRFWPIRIKKCDRDALARDRDDIWAEAVARFNAGEIWYLTDTLEETARLEQERRTIIDPWEDFIIEALNDGYMSNRDFISTNELLSEMKIEKSQQHAGTSKRISAIMRRLGWYYGRKRVDRVQQRGWSRPTAQESLDDNLNTGFDK